MGIKQIILPTGWVRCNLADVSDKLQYGWTTKAVDYGKVKLLRTTDISSGAVNWDSVPFCETEPEDVPKYLLNGGDIVVSRAGSVGKSFLISNPKHSVFASYLVRIVCHIDKKFLYYFMQSAEYWKKISDNTAGIAVPNVNASKLAAIEFSLPPLNEQNRIVAKIEELFSELDAGVENLTKAKGRLGVYRQSLLKHAFEGKLTEDWRKENADKLESGEALLKRVKKEREEYFKKQLEQWEKDVAQWEADGKPGKKPTKPKKPKKLAPISDEELKELPELPEGWVWERLGLLAEIQIGPFGSLLHKSDYIAGGTPLINPSHIQKGAIAYDPNFTVSPKKAQSLSHYLLNKGDVVIGRRGEMGRCAVVREDDGYFICGTGSLFARPMNTLYSEYCQQFLSSSFVVRYLEDKSIGTTMNNLNKTILNNIPVPVCPYTEQQKLANLIIVGIENETNLQQTLANESEKAIALKGSILRKAFSGQLVPQDPNDEPASKLLERIKQERKSTTKPKRTRKKSQATA